ncbi:MAG: zf-HC2 domain-containing protein, partial [Myxococcales bacterium]|nr:zf-HC2 domain-containing protein [Myxococcales bacterium]
MRCEDCHGHLLDLLYGELGDETRAGVEAHLAGCEACAGAYRRLCAGQAWAERLPVEEPPPAVELAGLALTGTPDARAVDGREDGPGEAGEAGSPTPPEAPSTPPHASRPRRRPRRTASWRVVAAAAGVLLVLGLGARVLREGGAEPASSGAVGSHTNEVPAAAGAGSSDRAAKPAADVPAATTRARATAAEAPAAEPS